MAISPATGKILGMVMAYAVSSLGLLLAYYNYRKRIVRADEIFSRAARRIIGSVIGLVIVFAVLGSAAVSGSGESPWDSIRSSATGILIPFLIFALSFWLTWLLYRHFVEKMK